MRSASPVNYETDWLRAEASSRSHISAVLLEIRREFGVSGCDVLELGSGIGTNLRMFLDDNRVLGVDGLTEAVAEARRQGIATTCADLEAALPLASSSADWIRRS